MTRIASILALVLFVAPPSLAQNSPSAVPDLTPDMVDDRLEKLARDAAGELLNKPREA